MAIQTALHFIQRVREDNDLQYRIEILGEEEVLEEIVQHASTLGFNFSVDDLVEAHKHDWSMRWAHVKHIKNKEA